jgi:hypothetical protein
VTLRQWVLCVTPATPDRFQTISQGCTCDEMEEYLTVMSPLLFHLQRVGIPLSLSQHPCCSLSLTQTRRSTTRRREEKKRAHQWTLQGSLRFHFTGRVKEAHGPVSHGMWRLCGTRERPRTHGRGPRLYGMDSKRNRIVSCRSMKPETRPNTDLRGFLV